MNVTERMLKVGTVPDSVTLNSLLQDLCNVRKTVEANKLRLLASSKGFEPDNKTYYTLVSGYTMEGNKVEGQRLVEEMLDKEFLPDIATYNRIMDRLSNTCKKRSYCHIHSSSKLVT